MQYVRFCETESNNSIQGIYRLSCNSVATYRVHWNRSLNPDLNQLNSIHTFTTYVLLNHFNIFFLSTSSSPKQVHVCSLQICS
jgi:hypothetical protein